ncbi:MAG: GMP synthase (glutamine-hydrolysing) [Candidatus Peregrinibacteria bacterium Gr01-1014_25]|nr:MAG: GMP synthase (glutamine-hydrolysing) [Candidatus Peregrinibacteria bacterium Gr01-1014_25]
MEAGIHPKSIVILDFGGQYAHLIANRVRRLGAFSEIRPPETPVSQLKDAAGIILSGGPQSVYETGSPQADPAILQLGIPVLGLCYGHQWLAHALGGTVKPAIVKEYGHTDVTVVATDTPLFHKLPECQSVWMSHGDEIAVLPPGFRTVASSADCANAAMADDARRIYGIQFHIEVTHTPHGMEILKRFVGLCDHAAWSVESFAAHVGADVKTRVGDRKVFMLVSGGVDSTVAFTLLSETLGPDRVQGLLVDTGLMRKDEVRQIQSALARLKLPNLHVEDASLLFLDRLQHAYDPEEKRRIIGDTFIDVQRTVSERMGLRMEDGWMLGQGTIYPDTIETGGTKHADHIKTHHNRVEAIARMIERGLVIEPVKELYKDEVRMLGEELGLPHDLVWRHPFPGPGLGVRILCAKEPVPVTYPDDATKAKTEAFLAEHAAIPLPVLTVGVQGDGRTYRHPLAVFSGTSPAGNADALALARSVPNAYRQFSRVVLCTSHDRMPATPFVFTGSGAITRERADLLREADAVVDAEMRAAGLYNDIWQFPVVILPFGLAIGGQSIVLRPIRSTDAMTADALPLGDELLQRITQRLLGLKHGDFSIDMVFHDLTSKPPATIEWE